MSARELKKLPKDLLAFCKIHRITTVGQFEDFSERMREQDIDRQIDEQLERLPESI